MRNKLGVLSLFLGLTFGLSACGWHLRGMGDSSGGTRLEQVSLVSASRFSEMTLAFVDALRKYGVAEASSAQWQLVLKEESLEKRTAAVNAIGSASQYELALTIFFLYRDTQETRVVPDLRQLSTQRVFDFDPSNTVAKREEENQLIAEMRTELARRIVRASSSLAATSQAAKDPDTNG